MNFAFFVHSAASDWNHGNAHFLRGLMSALAHAGHRVRSLEPRDGWSLRNLLADHGIAPVARFARAFPEIEVESYALADRPSELEETLEALIAGMDVVVVHEWNDAAVVNALASIRRRRGDFILLFHDTHHRPWSQPEAIAPFRLTDYDGVIAFGEVLREVYRRRFGVERAWTMHEAADVRRFHPLAREKTQDVIWIGNWGDEERTQELRDYWLTSARSLDDLRFVAHGVRYPDEALRELGASGVEFRGWLQSLDVPEAFARSRVTLHVPRRAYVQALRGIPTIRIFEALACGIPLVSAPWLDSEGLFRNGDLALATTPEEMRTHLRRLAADPDAAAAQAERGLETIRARHTCDHRAAELLEIVRVLGGAGAAGASGAEREVACA